MPPLDPFVSGSIISGGANLVGNLFGNLFGNKNTNKVNETNMKIAQMNNQWNAAEAAKTREFLTTQRDAQNQWNLDQWNRENEYNSAVSQRVRLEEAGLNPYLMMSGGSAGSASSISSSQVGTPSTPTAESVRQVPFLPRFDFSGVSEAINSYFQNKKIASETVGQNIVNDVDFHTLPEFREAQIASMLDGRFEFLNPSYKSGRFSEAANLLGVDIESKRQSLEGLKTHQQLQLAQSSLAYLSAETQRTLNKYLPMQQQADLWIKSSQVFVNYSAGMLSKEKLNTEIANQVKIAAETRGIRISNRVAANTATGIIRAMEQENQYNAEYYRFLKRSARDLAEFDIEGARLGLEMSKHEEKIARLNRRWRTPDKIVGYVGQILGGVPSAATHGYYMKKAFRASRGDSGSSRYPDSYGL